MTLTLHGFAVSNYYNKVKLALLEKGATFEEVYTPTRSEDPAVRAASPLRKIPFLNTPQGPLCESQVIVDWIEAAYPNPPLLPADPFQAAKVRELTTFIDWHLEMTARQLYGMVFFGGERLSDNALARIRTQLEQAIAALRQLVRFDPYVAGAQFTQADLSAFVNLPLVGMATKNAYGEDLLLAGGIDYKPYLQKVGERATVQKVLADRKAAQAEMAARAKG